MLFSLLLFSTGDLEQNIPVKSDVWFKKKKNEDNLLSKYVWELEITFHEVELYAELS